MTEDSNTARRSLHDNEAFLTVMSQNWAERFDVLPLEREGAEYARLRRDDLSEAFAGQRLVIAAGEMKVRANDTYYRFRASTEFSYLTAWGSDAEPGALLVFNPSGDGHDVVLFFRAAAGRDTAEFFSDAEVGEFWIGPRPTLAQTSADLGIECRDLSDFVATDSDVTLDDQHLRQVLSEMRLVKDDYEVRQMQEAVDATHDGFNAFLRELPRAVGAERGERVIEGVFNAHARLVGYDTGYETIAAAGAHACTLHWVRNDGAVHENDLVLVDAGIELDSLYTADITRTLPVSGRFSAIQRQIYEAVLEAADAAMAIVKPGIRFRDINDAALAVIERKVTEWGLVPADADPDASQYRRYMVHGTSHHLGLDVHDCAHARTEMYMDAVVQPGMVFTIEPGLYFQPDDLTVPEQYRGIGVRIEDDVVVTEDGCFNLSGQIPRTVKDVERWVRDRIDAN